MPGSAAGDVGGDEATRIASSVLEGPVVEGSRRRASVAEGLGDTAEKERRRPARRWPRSLAVWCQGICRLLAHGDQVPVLSRKRCCGLYNKRFRRPRERHKRVGYAVEKGLALHQPSDTGVFITDPINALEKETQMRSKTAVNNLLIISILALALPAAAQDPFPLATANGCVVYAGQGEGETESALGVRGIFLLQRQNDGRTFTFHIENVTFPPVPDPDGVTFRRVSYGNFRVLENGVKGTMRFNHLVVTNSADNPTSASFLDDGIILGGNRYETGGFYVQGTVNFTEFPSEATFTASTVVAVLCRDIGILTNAGLARFVQVRDRGFDRQFHAGAVPADP